MLDVVNGQERARGWPKKRGKKLHPTTIDQNEWFRQAQWATKFMPAEMYWKVAQAVQGSPLLPRDILTMMMAGRLLAFTGPDGTTIWSRQVLSDVSDALDAITNSPGAMLIRGEDGWIALMPGAAGDVLKIPDEGGAPAWLPDGGGTETGPLWYFQPPLAANFTLATGMTHGWAQWTDDGDCGLLFDAGAPQTGNRTVYAYHAIPDPTKDWNLVVRFDAFATNNAYNNVGPAAMSSANGRLTGGMITEARSFKFTRTTLTTFNGETARGWGPYEPHWIKMAKEGAYFRWYMSATGKNWNLVYEETIATWVVNNPDRIGFAVFYERSGGGPCVGAIQHWKFTQAA